jgi:hypothetical protein
LLVSWKLIVVDPKVMVEVALGFNLQGCHLPRSRLADIATIGSDFFGTDKIRWKLPGDFEVTVEIRIWTRQAR